MGETKESCFSAGSRVILVIGCKKYHDFFFPCFEILILLVLHCCMCEMASTSVKEFMLHFQPCFYSISRFCNFINKFEVKLENDSFALRSLIYQNSS